MARRVASQFKHCFVTDSPVIDDKADAEMAENRPPDTV